MPQLVSDIIEIAKIAGLSIWFFLGEYLEFWRKDPPDYYYPSL